VPEELKKTESSSLAVDVVKREPSAYFLARGLCNKGTRGASQTHGACMSQTRKAVAALFAVTVSTAVGIGYIHLEQTEERKVCPSARRRVIPIRAEFPASTRHVALATRRATDQTTG